MGYKVTFGTGQSVVFDHEPSQEDIEEAEASFSPQKKSITDYIKGEVAKPGNGPLDQLAGLGAGVGDLIGGMLPFAASTALKAGGALSGEDPSIVRQAADAAVADVYPTPSEISKRFGYGPTQNDVYKTLMGPFEAVSKGIEATGQLAGELTNNKSFGENTKTALEMGM